METVVVDLGDRSYPIHIGSNLFSSPELLLPHLQSDQVAIITNETVAPLYLAAVKKMLVGKKVHEIILPDGEQYKTLATIEIIYDSLLEQQFSRNATLIALGGGVIGDMVGFAAATYQRGINFIQIPTTLLSQVDSSVGGKTGVNRPLGKNMVGAFYQPRCVLADTTTLQTLAKKELVAGLAEVIKYGLINNAEFFHWLNGNIDDLLNCDQTALAYAIKVSCEEKAVIVSQDEKEAGIRAILNLGHTFGHAIETAMGYGKWLHGEAVGTGMVMAADLSWRAGLLSHDEAASACDLIARAGLPVVPPEIAVSQWLALMGRDKKAEMGKIKFILMQAIGQAVVRDDVEEKFLLETLETDKLLENN